MTREDVEDLGLKKDSIVLIGLTKSVRKWVVGLFEGINEDGKIYLRTHMVYQYGTSGAFTGEYIDPDDIFTIKLVAEPSKRNERIFEGCIAPLNYTIVRLIRRLNAITSAVGEISTSDEFFDND